MIANEEFILFIKLGENLHLDPEALDLYDQYVCKVYGDKKSQTVSQARLEVFEKTYVTTSAILNVKGIDGNSFPPCSSVMNNKLRRSNLVS